MKKLMSLIACVTALAFITPVFAQDEGGEKKAPKKTKKVKKEAKKDEAAAPTEKKAEKKAPKKVKKAKKEEE